MSDAAGSPTLAAPDGARLLDLPMRRTWLGRPEIAQAAPRVGVLLLATDGVPLVRWSAREGNIERLSGGLLGPCEPRAVGAADLTDAWLAAWLEPRDTARAPAALLFDRGMLGEADEGSPLVHALRRYDQAR
ncbi:MAG: hypothetical protein H6698_02070 [Myxococcales bacterium]|nr:hypothetical protein [Myxococcales bacterium]